MRRRASPRHRRRAAATLQTLAGRAQRLPARGKDRQPRTRAQQRLDEVRARVDDVLAVVEDEELGARLEECGRRSRGRPQSRLGLYRECDSRRDRSGSVTPASSTNQTPSGKAGSTASARCNASRVLPLPPGPDERDEPGRRRTRLSSARGHVATDERGQRGGEVVRRRRRTHRRTSSGRRGRRRGSKASPPAIARCTRSRHGSGTTVSSVSRPGVGRSP